MNQMKKALVLITLITLILFSGCEKKNTESSAAYQDGTYMGTYQNFDSHGWKPQLEIVIQKGKIIEANWDYVNPAGELKSEDARYAEIMEGRSGTTPAKAKALLEETLIERQEAGTVDDVTGATHSSHTFKELAEAILENAAEGDSSKVMLPMNDTYTAKDEEDDHGWTGQIAITYVDNKITAVDYQELNADEMKKVDDANYATMMSDKSGVTPAEAKKQLEEQLIEKQSTDIDGVTGATGTTNRFISLAEEIISSRK